MQDCEKKKIDATQKVTKNMLFTFFLQNLSIKTFNYSNNVSVLCSFDNILSLNHHIIIPKEFCWFILNSIDNTNISKIILDFNLFFKIKFFR